MGENEDITAIQNKYDQRCDEPDDIGCVMGDTMDCVMLPCPETKKMNSSAKLFHKKNQPASEEIKPCGKVYTGSVQPASSISDCRCDNPHPSLFAQEFDSLSPQAGIACNIQCDLYSASTQLNAS
jgi:hypothetical protein